MAIKDWPLDDRPREKLLAQGATHLSDAEILSIFIRTGMKGQSALDISRELFIQFGSWTSLMTTELKTFCQIPGLGMTKYVALQAACEVGRRYAQEPLQMRDVFSNARITYRFLSAKMKDYTREVFACLFLNNANHLIKFQELFYGTVNLSTVHPREIIKAALDEHAVAVIAVHNHPSGVVTPSPADIRVTQRLKQALSFVDIRLLDHIIVGKGGVITSFMEQGLL
jgi:DNA repair protein RadC